MKRSHWLVLSLSIVLIGLSIQPSWAEGGKAMTCPATPPVMKWRPGLQGVARDVAASSGVRILAIGSSSTEGVGASSPANTYPRQLEAALERSFSGIDVTVENAGIGGETADATVARLEAALRHGEKPDLVIWQVGTNDAIRGGDVGQFQALLERGIGAARQAGIDLILLDQQFYPAIPDATRYERFVHVVEAVAVKASVGLFSRYKMMKAWSAIDAGLLRIMLSKDQFHMGDQGYRCLAFAFGDEIASAVRAVMRQASAGAREERVTLSPIHSASRY